MLENLKKVFGLKKEKNEKHEAYMAIMNTKKVYSLLSDQLVEFTDEIEAHRGEASGAYFNGWLLLDNIADSEGEDDNIYVTLKDGNNMNLHDFVNEYGIWEDEDRFLENVKMLIADREA